MYIYCKIKKLFIIIKDFLLDIPIKFIILFLRYRMLPKVPKPKTGSACIVWIKLYVETGEFKRLSSFLLQFSPMLLRLTNGETQKIEEYLDSVSKRKDRHFFEVFVRTGLYTGNFRRFIWNLEKQSQK